MGDKTALTKGSEQAIHMPGLLYAAGVDKDPASLMVDLFAQSAGEGKAIAAGLLSQYIEVNLSH